MNCYFMDLETVHSEGFGRDQSLVAHSALEMFILLMKNKIIFVLKIV